MRVPKIGAPLEDMISHRLRPVTDPLKLLFGFQQWATAEMAEKELIALLSVNKNQRHPGGKNIARFTPGIPASFAGVVPRSLGKTFTW